MSDPLSIKCPNCGSGLKVKDHSLIGKKVPCPKCKVPFPIAVNVAAAPVDVPTAEVGGHLWEETRLWRCPWCAKDVQLLVNEPDPFSCDHCRANVQIPEPVTNPMVPAVSKISTGLQSQPTSGGLSRKRPKAQEWYCPSCEGPVSEHAEKCRHCGEFLTDTGHSNLLAGCLGFFLGPVGLWYKGHWAAGFAWLAMAFATGVFSAGIGFIFMPLFWLGMGVHAIVAKPRR